MSRPRNRSTQTAAEALASVIHVILGPDPRGPRPLPLSIVVPIEYLPTPRATQPGLAGVTEAYHREWRARCRERRVRGGAA